MPWMTARSGAVADATHHPPVPEQPNGQERRLEAPREFLAHNERIG
jgi:hypothetical protein